MQLPESMVRAFRTDMDHPLSPGQKTVIVQRLADGEAPLDIAARLSLSAGSVAALANSEANLIQLLSFPNSRAETARLLKVARHRWEWE